MLYNLWGHELWNATPYSLYVFFLYFTNFSLTKGLLKTCPKNCQRCRQTLFAGIFVVGNGAYPGQITGRFQAPVFQNRYRVHKKRTAWGSPRLHGNHRHEHLWNRLHHWFQQSKLFLQDFQGKIRHKPQCVYETTGKDPERSGHWKRKDYLNNLRIR